MSRPSRVPPRVGPRGGHRPRPEASQVRGRLRWSHGDKPAGPCRSLCVPLRGISRRPSTVREYTRKWRGPGSDSPRRLIRLGECSWRPVTSDQTSSSQVATGAKVGVNPVPGVRRPGRPLADGQRVGDPRPARPTPDSDRPISFGSPQLQDGEDTPGSLAALVLGLAQGGRHVQVGAQNSHDTVGVGVRRPRCRGVEAQ